MGRGRSVKKREELQDRFLVLLRQTGLVAESARLMKVSPNLPYTWKRQSEAFKEAFAVAMSEGHETLADRLERALTTRAEEGFTQGVYYKGEKVGEQRLFSDTAAIVMLKSLRPERFIEQQVGVNVQGQQMVVKILTFSQPLPPMRPSGAGAGERSSAPERPGSLNGSATPELVEESPR